MEELLKRLEQLEESQKKLVEENKILKGRLNWANFRIAGCEEELVRLDRVDRSMKNAMSTLADNDFKQSYRIQALRQEKNIQP